MFLSPILCAFIAVIWLQDKKNPFYIAPRAACREGTFMMIKLRSMVVDADKFGSTSATISDKRITKLGTIIRSYKIDELMQLWNVLKGDMSLVGPRPQVMSCVELYTNEERRMLSVRPGITDPASIVFSDQGQILEGCGDPDLVYNQIIRPWKSRLSLAYIDHRNFWIDIQIIILTVIAIISKPIALRALGVLLRSWKLDPVTIRMSLREDDLIPFAPPGGTG
jgi:lipopolysaccharide/colanic/teichoic acid biosynthesis glycosyltransferase